ncbi:MAG: signal peptidase II [Candidatus Dormibacteraeota bacterium]|nr:signal peptidase II [Candidatus Dormibacteraeota bacterium]
MLQGRLLFSAVALLVFIADRISKRMVVASVPLGTERQALPHVWITNTQNPGAAFGVAQEATAFFLIASVVVAIGLIFYAARTPIGISTGVLLGLILGGTVGNGYDRLLHGTVTDFIALHFWPVFNVADSAISVGVVLLLIGYVLRQKGRPSG